MLDFFICLLLWEIINLFLFSNKGVMFLSLHICYLLVEVFLSNGELYFYVNESCVVV